MNYANFKEYDIANGPGIRFSLFVSGCTHHCKGCFNQETWDFNYGKPFTKETEDYILKEVGQEFYEGLTLLFKGSSNQRTIDVQKSLASGTVVPWDPRDTSMSPNSKI